MRSNTLVVIDVAMTETAKLAHYILPTATQFEKAKPRSSISSSRRTAFSLETAPPNAAGRTSPGGRNPRATHGGL